MSNVDQWSQISGENADPTPDGAPEGHARVDVNDITRELQSAVRREKENLAWFDKTKGPVGLGFTLTKLSDNSVNLVHESTPTDASGKFVVGVRVRIGDGSTFVYGYVTSSVYANPNTVIDLDLDGAAVVQATPTTIENHVTDNFVGKAAFSPVGVTLAQDPPEIPSIDLLGDGVTVDQGTGNGFDADTVDGQHAVDIIASAAASDGVGLINGNFAIGQRGHTINDASYYLNDNAAYVADGWALLMGDLTAHPLTTEGVVDIDLIAANATGGAADSRAIRLTGNSHVTSAPLEKIGLIQWLPFDVTESLRSGTVSLSVWCRIPASGFQQLRLAIVEWTGAADALTSVDPINDWGAVDVDPTVLSSRSISIGAKETVSATWTEFQFENVSVSASVNNLAVLIYMDDTAWASGDIFELTGVSLVKGASARAYSHEDYSLNLQRCQRFFNSSFEEGTAPVDQNSGAAIKASALRCSSDGTNAMLVWEFGTSMHKVPDVTTFSPDTGGAAASPWNETAGVDEAKASTSKSKRRVNWRVSRAGSNTGDEIIMHATAEASL